MAGTAPTASEGGLRPPLRILPEYKIQKLGKSSFPPDYRVVWDGNDALGRSVSTGVYLSRLVSNGYVQTRRMLLLK